MVRESSYEKNGKEKISPNFAIWEFASIMVNDYIVIEFYTIPK